MTYDGQYRYVYDAWNQLAEVHRAYRDSGGTLQSGSKIATLTYDGVGRRVKKFVEHCGDMDATYHYYYNGQSQAEVRNGSNQVISQQVWGLQYIDELVQTGLNSNPWGDKKDYW